ncbi:hypothetical protein BDQ12DRAFT_640922 [Crucibulum laeve]|uniref:BAG domain-containing protein n=1 Tax=Crucibulum laeve TaxID=68775 RepID=A0A5C3MJ12_9AGAR|nr:hypothetical protein BDQ12DRAFT_640922 [Crucibulum laeve]
MPVTVKWGRERITFDLPPPDTKLAAVRASLADYTHLPRDAFKLIHAGALMRDDNAPISAYHLHPNSTIALIGHDQPLPPMPNQHHHPPTQPQPRSEQSIIATIQSELNHVRSELTPAVQKFLITLPNTPNQEKEHTRLGEMLLQSLLRLDGITTNHDWEDARRERKEAVREVQGMLDRVDGAWEDRTN